MPKWLIILSIAFFSACSTTNPVHNAGMIQLSPDIYVDPEMSVSRQQQLLVDIDRAKERIAHVFGGSMQSRPIIYACISQHCLDSFSDNHRTPEKKILKESDYLYFRAKAMGGAKILLAESGANVTIISHEMAHVEFHQRLGKRFNINRIPMWFDEGLAVMVCQNPNYIHRGHLPTHDLNRTLRTEVQWLTAMKNKERPYERSYQLVKQWYEWVGPEGLLQTIEQMKQTGRFTLTPPSKSTLSTKIASH